MKKYIITGIIILVLSGCSNDYSDRINVYSNNLSNDCIVGTEALKNENVCNITSENVFIFERNKNASSVDTCINQKNTKFPGKVCRCEETDTLFFSDVSGLYMSAEGITVKLSDMRAHGISIYEGKLYFAHSEKPLLTNIFPSTYAGSIYCYDISKNELSLVEDTEATNLYIFDDQIIYDVTEVMNIENGYAIITHKKLLNEGIIIEEYLDRNPFVFDDDIYAYRKTNSNELCVENMRKELLFESEPVMACTKLSLANDRLWYIDYLDGMGKIHTIGINGEDEKVFSIPNIYIDDYTIIGDLLYTTTSGASLYSFDSQGNITYYRCAIDHGKLEPMIEAIYCVGDDILGMERDGYLYKAVISEKGEMYTVSWERFH